VRPGPDPARPEDDTKWMTEEQIRAEALKPSTHWIAAGSGGVGKLYLELIGCDKLPNMDSVTLNFHDKTDAFACIVYEDCIVNTDVITNSLSPRWMPWCNRAFAFNIAHPSSDIFIGIFDHDPELSPLQLASRATSTIHDPIGRLVINANNFKPGTSYLLTVSILVH
jgi:C2 domain